MSVSLNEKISSFRNIKSNSEPLFFILGPCVIENEDHTLMVAEFLKKLSEKLKFRFIFKSCFDKANRTSISGYRGVGFEKGLQILARVRKEFEVPVITDVHESHQVGAVAEVVDVIQIPAFLCRQTDLLIAAGRTDKIIHVKKGQFITAENMKTVTGKIESTGNTNIWFCERGYIFGYSNLIVDYRNFPIMKRFRKPIVFDATHSVQRPSGQGDCSGGDREFVSSLATSAVAQRIAGVFMEVHDNPEKALCDGPNSIRLSQLEYLLRYLIDLDEFVKNNEFPKIN
jgi:2-dehydro-3-deoxyphosphooctonate aldolase (KDO 8-P synthase)